MYEINQSFSYRQLPKGSSPFDLFISFLKGLLMGSLVENQQVLLGSVRKYLIPQPRPNANR